MGRSKARPFKQSLLFSPGSSLLSPILSRMMWVWTILAVDWPLRDSLAPEIMISFTDLMIATIKVRALKQ